MHRHAVAAARLFTGEAFITDHAVLIEAGRVLDIVPTPRLAHGITVEHVAEKLLLAPGFIDVQVNGGGGVLFNDSPDLQTLRRIVQAHRRFGTTSLLPTLITDTSEKLHQAVATVAAAMANDEPGIAGLHLEGPFLNPARRGVHRADFIRAPTPADIAYLCANTPPFLMPLSRSAGEGAVAAATAGEGRRRQLLLTLAPEMVPPDTIRCLSDAGIIVSLGHTDATHEQAKAALDEGARGFTHLFNAMPPPAGRAPGPVGAALDDPHAFAGIIADGHHVHPANLRIALRALTPQRTMLVTDAMASVGADIHTFMLQGRRIAVAEGRLTTEDGTLAGAHLDMASAVRNAITLLGATLADALRIASATPADFLGIAAARGRLLPGRVADMVALTDSIAVRAVWIAGAPALAAPGTAC
jgi:N-acetylglucosamine-6-phosphate deacetylase